MDQIMWMLSLIPDAWLTVAVHAMTLVGLAAVLSGYLLRRIPIIDQYATLARVLGTVLLVAGVYFQGGMRNEQAWRARVADMEAKVKAAEVKSEQTNARLEARVVERTRIVREKADVQIEYINRVVKGDTVEIIKDLSEAERAAFLAKQKELQDAVKNCPVPRIIIEEHNRATENK